MAAATDAPPAPSGRRRRSRRWALGVAGVLLLGGLAAGGWWWFDDAAATEDGQPAEGEILTVEPMTVGLAGGGHARLRYGLVLADDASPEALEEHLPLMQDAALGRVAGMGAGELGTPQGMETLKERLALDAREIFNDPDDEPAVLRVVLTELVVR